MEFQMNYKDILNNEKVIQIYKQIDLINPSAFDHGTKHVNNVCKIMNNLCNTLKIDKDEKEALLIACALHDLGRGEGKEKHGFRAKEYTIKEFGEQLHLNPYYNDIIESIEHHSHIDNNDLSFFSILVQFVDKMDFTKNRMVDNYRERFRYYCYEDINEIKIIYTSTDFGINILTNDIEDFKTQLMKESFPGKAFKMVIKLASKLNRNPVIQHNGKILISPDELKSEEI